MQIDYGYLCENLGHLSGLQVRVWHGQETVHEYANRGFEPDPVTPLLEAIRASQHEVSYFDLLSLVFFGVIKVPSDDTTIIVGPTSQIGLSDTQLAALLRHLGQSQDRIDELRDYFAATAGYPLENFLHILCFVNYALNGSKLSVLDIIGQQTSHLRLTLDTAKRARQRTPPPQVHNTVEMERELYSLITMGRPAALREQFKQPPTGRVGKIAHSEMRQRKNVFVISAALAARAAISGGLPAEDALQLSDLYIQKAELLNDFQQLTLLSMDLLLEFATRVEQVNAPGARTELVVAVAQFVATHIDERLTTSDVAAQVGINRTQLCERFRREAGMTVREFITAQKLREAQRLLRTTDQTILQISDHLGFSSQGYFQNVFRKAVGCTPRTYRRTPPPAFPSRV